MCTDFSFWRYTQRRNARLLHINCTNKLSLSFSPQGVTGVSILYPMLPQGLCRPRIGYDNQECIALVQMYSEMKSSKCISTQFKMASHFCQSVQQILWISNNSFSDRFQLVTFGAPIQFHGFIHHFSRGSDPNSWYCSRFPSGHRFNSNS